MDYRTVTARYTSIFGLDLVFIRVSQNQLEDAESGRSSSSSLLSAPAQPWASSLSNLSTACARFLCDVEHLPGSHHMALPTLKVSAFVATCKSVAFTLSMVVAERGHGLVSEGEVEEAADVAHFQRLNYVTRVLQYAAQQEGMAGLLEEVMHQRLSGGGDEGGPLLAHNLLTTLVMAAVLPSYGRSKEVLMETVRDLYLARVLQQLWGSGGLQQSSSLVASSPLSSSLNKGMASSCSTSDILGPVGCLASKLATLLLSTADSTVDKLKVSSSSGGAVAMDDDSNEGGKNLESEVAGAAGAFLRASLLLVVTVPGREVMFGDRALPPNHATLETLQAFFEVGRWVGR